MFRRRQSLTATDRIRGALWPRSGWRRALRYMGHRLRRLPGTAEAVACGFAIGVAVSFTPFLGLHVMLALLLCWLVRANMVAAVVGTLVGNPWTFPFIWVLCFQLGARLVGVAPGEALPSALSVHYIQDVLGFVLLGDATGDTIRGEITWAYIFDEFAFIFLPLLVGGLIMALLSFFFVYFPLRNVIIRARQLRANRHPGRLKGGLRDRRYALEARASRVAKTARKAITSHRRKDGNGDGEQVADR